jgi:hypothetical protein
MQIKIYNNFRCVCWFPRLVLDQRVCSRKFGSRSAIFILCAFIPFMLDRNAIIGIVYFQKLPLGCLLS